MFKKMLLVVIGLVLASSVFAGDYEDGVVLLWPKKDYIGARAKFVAVLESDANAVLKSLAQLRLGRTYAGEKDYAKAREEYAKVPAMAGVLNSTVQESKIHTGISYFGEGDNQKAVDILNATEKDNCHVDLYLYTGMAYIKLGEHQKANDALVAGCLVPNAPVKWQIDSCFKRINREFISDEAYAALVDKLLRRILPTTANEDFVLMLKKVKDFE